MVIFELDRNRRFKETNTNQIKTNESFKQVTNKNSIKYKIGKHILLRIIISL